MGSLGCVWDVFLSLLFWLFGYGFWVVVGGVFWVWLFMSGCCWAVCVLCLGLSFYFLPVSSLCSSSLGCLVFVGCLFSFLAIFLGFWITCRPFAVILDGYGCLEAATLPLSDDAATLVKPYSSSLMCCFTIMDYSFTGLNLLSYRYLHWTQSATLTFWLMLYGNLGCVWLSYHSYPSCTHHARALH